ncbi:SapC [Mesorhizobium australicum WSM2073]|uniref:SapC n=1 Tax=Mesorhizobium australicum (strain HAMBI 3006 / LMG 24608 / WSM2073) TaxID=754035 RepID=L0KEE8_MESAW|nr:MULTISPECIES: SapC family protein [Mesorhizobium]AGB43376.1 SapC [Mesorhizobium australicum WSM2073]MBZ9909850.1 SapC family protein [Mesorhizobium sp. BR115XR7A]MBZ9933499.1 SapC family protein [Mesorhizobium sp. BR1-1-5]
MADSGVKTETAPAGEALPLFYSRPEALNPARHGSLGLTARSDFSFARSAHAIPVVASEMPAAMRSYPIVFIGAAKAPVIITGVRQDENLFVDADGKWNAPHYIPAYVRRYPFILAEDPTSAGRLTLCVDRASDRVVDQLMAPFRDDKVLPFFGGNEPTEATRQALAFCNQFQIDFRATREMVDKIDAHGLFSPRQSKVTLEGGEVLNLTDFQVIDEAAFNKLSDEAFLDLRKSGALGLLYCHLASTNSWTSLVHQASLRKAETAKSA